MNTDTLYIVCTESGTIIPLYAARIVDTSELDETQTDCFTTGSDWDVSELAIRVGKPVVHS